MTAPCSRLLQAARQRRPDGNGGWRWDLGGVERVLYHLPELIASPAGGVPLTVASRRLRHCTIRVTADLEQHVDAAPDTDAAPGAGHASQTAPSYWFLLVVTPGRNRAAWT